MEYKPSIYKVEVDGVEIRLPKIVEDALKKGVCSLFSVGERGSEKIYLAWPRWVSITYLLEVKHMVIDGHTTSGDVILSTFEEIELPHGVVPSISDERLELNGTITVEKGDKTVLHLGPIVFEADECGKTKSWNILTICNDEYVCGGCRLHKPYTSPEMPPSTKKPARSSALLTSINRFCRKFTNKSKKPTDAKGVRAVVSINGD